MPIIGKTRRRTTTRDKKKNDTGMWRNVPVYTSINTKGTTEKCERTKGKKNDREIIV